MLVLAPFEIDSSMVSTQKSVLKKNAPGLKTLAKICQHLDNKTKPKPRELKLVVLSMMKLKNG